MANIEVGSARADGPGRFEGILTVGAMPDGAAVEIPVVIVRGQRDGPALWLHGCVHGNEYCGTYIIHEFLRGLDPAALRGTVVALPILKSTGLSGATAHEPVRRVQQRRYEPLLSGQAGRRLHRADGLCGL